MKKVICIGSATKDIFLPLDDTRVIENTGDVTAQKLMAFEYGAKIYANDIFELVGGSAVNVAAGLCLGGCRSYVFSRTSKNEIGKWILKNIGKLGIKKNYLQQNGKIQSEVAVVILDKKTAEHCILRTGDSVESFDLGKALDSYDEKVDWIYVGSLKKGWQQNMARIVSFAEKKHAKIAFNPSGYQISNDAKQLVEFFSKVAAVFMNRDEAIELVQNIEGHVDDNPKRLHGQLLSYGCQVVTITDGQNGAYTGENILYHLGTRAVKKIDSLGAGDAFCSGFLSSYINHGDLPKALAWGIANSASVLSDFGGTRGLLDKKELKRRGHEFMAGVQVI